MWCVRCAPGSSGEWEIRRDTSVLQRGGSLCGSSVEPCSVENVLPGFEVEEDWLSTDADQGPNAT